MMRNLDSRDGVNHLAGLQIENHNCFCALRGGEHSLRFEVDEEVVKTSRHAAGELVLAHLLERCPVWALSAPEFFSCRAKIDADTSTKIPQDNTKMTILLI